MNDRTERERISYRPEVIKRFWSYVDRSAGPDACWPWMGYRDNRSGYGRFRADTVGYLPHRWILGYARRAPLDWSAREMACHSCDNPSCCNPAHLYVGDQFQNMRDSVERGRHFEASKTHCKQGHPLSGPNLYVNASSGQRCFRTCRLAWQRKADRKRRAST